MNNQLIGGGGGDVMRKLGGVIKSIHVSFGYRIASRVFCPVIWLDNCECAVMECQ